MPSSRRVWITAMALSPDHQITSPTGYSTFLTQRHVSSRAPGSATAASHLCCTMTYTGLTFRSAFSSSWTSQCVVAYRIRLRFTWWTAVVESLTLSVCVGCIIRRKWNHSSNVTEARINYFTSIYRESPRSYQSRRNTILWSWDTILRCSSSLTLYIECGPLYTVTASWTTYDIGSTAWSCNVGLFEGSLRRPRRLSYSSPRNTSCRNVGRNVIIFDVFLISKHHQLRERPGRR